MLPVNNSLFRRVGLLLLGPNKVLMHMVTLTCVKETNDVCIYMGVRVCIRSNDEYYTLGFLFMWCSMQELNVP